VYQRKRKRKKKRKRKRKRKRNITTTAASELHKLNQLRVIRSWFRL